MIAGFGETIALIYLLTVFLPFVFIIITNCCLPFMFASHRRTSNLRSSRDNASVETELAKTTIIEVLSFNLRQFWKIKSSAFILGLLPMIIVLLLLTVYFDKVTPSIGYNSFSLRFKDNLRHFEEIASLLFYLNGLFIQSVTIFRGTTFRKDFRSIFCTPEGRRSSLSTERTSMDKTTTSSVSKQSVSSVSRKQSSPE